MNWRRRAQQLKCTKEEALGFAIAWVNAPQIRFSSTTVNANPTVPTHTHNYAICRIYTDPLLLATIVPTLVPNCNVKLEAVLTKTTPSLLMEAG